MVDRPNVQLEWSLDNHTSPRLDDNNRCVAKGLGGSVPGQTHEGTLDTGGIQFPSHKCFGAESSSFCCEGLHSQSKAASCPPENGHQDSSCLLVEDGEDTVPPFARELWEYALNKQITLTAEYLLGELNHEADWQSRHFRNSSNWKLDPTVFQSLHHLWGPLKIDLFVDRMNTQLQLHLSWFAEPFAQGTDAFQIPWSNLQLRGYSFPPFLNDMSLSSEDPIRRPIRRQLF